MRDTVFFRQAELLLRISPLIHKEEVFTLDDITHTLIRVSKEIERKIPGTQIV